MTLRRRCSRVAIGVAIGVAIAARIVCSSAPVSAQAAPPAPHDDEAFDVMNLLARHGLHDIAR
ncbi:MAG: hypothetical protein WCJ30_24925, partial [Deltaproteobacteria bacterium]